MVPVSRFSSAGPQQRNEWQVGGEDYSVHTLLHYFLFCLKNPKISCKPRLESYFSVEV